MCIVCLWLLQSISAIAESLSAISEYLFDIDLIGVWLYLGWFSFLIFISIANFLSWFTWIAFFIYLGWFSSLNFISIANFLSWFTWIAFFILWCHYWRSLEECWLIVLSFIFRSFPTTLWSDDFAGTFLQNLVFANLSIAIDKFAFIAREPWQLMYVPVGLERDRVF